MTQSPARPDRPRATTTIVVVPLAAAIVVAGGWIAVDAVRHQPRPAALATPAVPPVVVSVPPAETDAGPPPESPTSTTTPASTTTPITPPPGPPPEQPHTVTVATTAPPVTTTAPPLTAAAVAEVAYVSGADAILNAASGHGCKAWLNSRTPGPYAQGLLQSWGDDCEMSLWQSTDGGAHFSLESGKHRRRSGTATTYFYWAGPGHLARACLTDYTIGRTACGKPFGA